MQALKARQKQTSILMRQHFGCTIALVGLALLGSPSICVAQVHSWERLSSVELGSRLTVVSANGSTVDGTLREWAPSTLVLQQKDRVVSVPRSDVQKVTLVTGRSHLSRVGRLALLGGAVGGTLFGAVCASRDNCGASPAALGAGAALVAIQAAMGGARFAPLHSEVIYLADQQLQSAARD